MTQPTRPATRLATIIETTQCPYCDARPGQPCRANSGLIYGDDLPLRIHRARRYQYDEEAWRRRFLGLHET